MLGTFLHGSFDRGRSRIAEIRILQSREDGTQAPQSGADGAYIDSLARTGEFTYAPGMVEDQEDNLDGIRKLYPHMTDAELRIARTNLRYYSAVILRIHDRLKVEGKIWPRVR